MTLSAEEYHDHLKTTAVRAGFSFDQLILPSEHDVSVGQLRFRYLDWGTKGLRPILFLHGGALTAHTWDLCCLALRGEFHCVALDQRGHGDSDWAPDADYSIDAQREDIRGFADRLGLDRFALVGQSMGAINGLAFAVAHPERLSALVMIDAGPEVRRRGSSRIREFVNGGAKPETLEEIIERALAFNPRRDPARRQPRQRHLSRLGRARRRERRLPPGRCRTLGAEFSQWPANHDCAGRTHRAGRQPKGLGRRAARLSRLRE